MSKGIMKPNAVFIVILIIGVAVFLYVKELESVSVSKLYSEINRKRYIYNSQLLTIDPLLEKSAQDKCNDMLDNLYYSHADKNGVIWATIEKYYPVHKTLGENLAVTDRGTYSVMNGWENSKKHRENITDKRFSRFGIATCSSKEYSKFIGHGNITLVVNHFAE